MSIEFIPAVCPKCGGELRVPSNIDRVKCMYCGVDILLSKINTNKPDIDTLISLANTSFTGKNYSEAYQYYARVLEVDQNNSVAWLGKAKCAAWLSSLEEPRFTEADACFQQVYILGCDNPKLMEETLLEIIRSHNFLMKTSFDKLVFELKKYKGKGERMRPICENLVQDWSNKFRNIICASVLQQARQMQSFYAKFPEFFSSSTNAQIIRSECMAIMEFSQRLSSTSSPITIDLS